MPALHRTLARCIKFIRIDSPNDNTCNQLENHDNSKRVDTSISSGPTPEFTVKSTRLIPSIAIQTLSSGIVAAISFGLVILLGRYMGPTDFGYYNFILSIASLFFILQDGGFKTIIYREMTAPTYSKAVSDTAFPFGLGYLLVTTAAGIAICWLPGIPANLSQTLSAGICCFSLVASTGFLSAKFQAHGEFGKDAMWQVSLRLSSALIMMPTVIWLSQSPAAMFMAWACGLALCLVIAWRHLPTPKLKGLQRSPLISACASIVFINASTTLYHRLDIIMLEAMKGAETVGIYAAPYRFLDGLILLATPVSAVLFRHLRQLKDDSNTFQKELIRVAGLLFAAAIGLFAFVTIAKDILIHYTYGPAFQASASLLPILFSALLFILPNAVFTQAAIAANKERAYALAGLLCAGLNAALNYAIIPRYGAHGAAIATVATEAALTILLVLALKRNRHT